ncbi:hypothetical protein SLA2020_027660 [Shorea laevis]
MQIPSKKSGSRWRGTQRFLDTRRWARTPPNLPISSASETLTHIYSSSQARSVTNMKKISDFLRFFEDGGVRSGHLAAGVGLAKGGLKHSGELISMVVGW